MTETQPPEHVSAQGEKLQKVLARAGFGSRREMERAISGGRVLVDGRVARLGDRVGDREKIIFDGKLVNSGAPSSQPTRVLLYNKPEGEICSRADPEGRPTVYQHLPLLNVGRWISVGRLDFNTTGLLLFTNNGDLANRLMHPASNIDREYLVRVQGSVDEGMIERLKEGVVLDDGVAKFTDVVAGSSDGSNLWYYCVVMEGKNREVRRLWESQGVRVSRLKRVRYGNIFIPSHVRVGQWVEFNFTQVCDLCAMADFPKPAKPKFSAQLKNQRERHERRLRSRTKAPAARPRNVRPETEGKSRAKTSGASKKRSKP